MNIGDIVTMRNYPSTYIISRAYTNTWDRYEIIDLETGYIHRDIGGGQMVVI